MALFEWHRPSTLEEVNDLLSRYGGMAKLIAGGTALVLMMKQKLKNRIFAKSLLLFICKLGSLL